MNGFAECWGGPFCGRMVRADGPLTVTEGPNTGMVALGIGFIGGKEIGRYVPKAADGGRLIWHPTAQVSR